MNKRTLFLLAIGILVVLAAGLLLYVRTNSDGTDPAKETRTEQVADSDTTEAAPDSGTVRIQSWKVTFTLPERIKSEDVRMITQTVNNQEITTIGDTSLTSKINKELCTGPVANIGAFMMIERHSTAGQDRIKAGDYYYTISDSSAFRECYKDEEVLKTYFKDDIAKTAKASLKNY